MLAACKVKRQAFVLVALFVFARLSVGAPLVVVGHVAFIPDGDTLTVVDAGNSHHKVRLSRIDAPEIGQPFGHAPMQNLARYVSKREVVAQCPKRDRFGRSVCLVRVNGEDANLAQIRDGMAWHFKRYEDEQPPGKRAGYGQAEGWARAQREGLWRDTSAVPSWEWRTRR